VEYVRAGEKGRKVRMCGGENGWYQGRGVI